MIKFKQKNVLLFFFIMAVASISMLVFACTSEANTAALKAAEKKQNDPHKAFHKWKMENKSEVYYIAENTFTCHTRDKYINIFNMAQSTNWTCSIAKVKRWGGEIFEGPSICRILEQKPNDKIVKIQYTRPYTRDLPRKAAWLDSMERH